jgi:glucuronate isomerase
LSDDFLLETDAAVYLYERHAAKMPIVDFHNHLSPKTLPKTGSSKTYRDMA